MILRKLILSSMVLISFLDAKDLEINLKNITLHKDMKISKQLAYLKKNDSYDRKFELGVYFGEMLLYKPNIKKKLINLYKYNPERDTLFIALKKANIKNTFYKEENNYKIVDPMSYKKYYYNSVKVIIGSFRFHLDEKYINKIEELKGCTYGLCTIPANNLRKEYGLKIKEEKTKIETKEKNTTEPIDLPF